MPDTFNQIVNLAEELIRSKGYNAFSYKDISFTLGVKNAAIHYHFPSKADLGVAVINRNRERFRHSIDNWQNKGQAQKLKSFIHIYGDSKKRNLVCFMGALGPAFETLPEQMKSALRIASSEIRQYVAQVLSEGKTSGEFAFEDDPHEKADMLVSSLMASLVVSRVSGENVFQNVEKVILRSI